MTSKLCKRQLFLIVSRLLESVNISLAEGAPGRYGRQTFTEIEDVLAKCHTKSTI